ncbi:hypothetical protein [Nocardioides daphniae]|uniref:hypothetical protein n=1 Tax=Nocardioides daphniae TaxID=402297 RepID=UPI001EE981BA|nr:hypothetical protein [Nocardioides daphniae]
MNSQTGRVDDSLVNLGLIGIAALALLAAVLRGAGALTAWVTGATAPRTGWAGGLAVLRHPGDPAHALDAEHLNVWVYWSVVVVLLGVTVTSVVWGWARFNSTGRVSRPDPRRLAGVATRSDVRTTASRRALLARGRTLRPSLIHPRAADVGYLLGRSQGHEVWASVEDSMLLLGPPRSGKGLHVVINAILDAPGAVITTATRPDNIAAPSPPAKPEGPSRCSTPNASPKACPPACAGPPSAAARTPSPR